MKTKNRAWQGLDITCRVVGKNDVLLTCFACEFENAGACSHVDVLGRFDQVDQVLRHRGGQRNSSHQHRDGTGESGQIHRRLAGRVATTDDENVPSSASNCFGNGRAIVHPCSGESTSNQQAVISGWSDVQVTDRGRRQAVWTAQAFAETVGVVALYASPLPRAWETATIIGAALGMSPVPIDDLREINTGLAEGRQFQEVVGEYPDLQRQIDQDTLDFLWPGTARATSTIARPPLA